MFNWWKKLFKKDNPPNYTFASQNKVNELYVETKEFVEEILGYDINGIFLSDKSSLYDFAKSPNDNEGRTIADILRKVKETYSVDITPVKNKSIVEIVAYVKKKKN